MNKKYKVMNQKPEASDEEIQSYMNFQGLIDKRAEVLSSSKRSSTIKKSIGGVLILVVALSVVWFFQKQETRNDEQSGEQKIGQMQTPTQDESVSDSLVTEQPLVQ